MSVNKLTQKGLTMGRLQLKSDPHKADKPDWWTSDEWSTPPEFIAGLVKRFGAFDLDPCCRHETAKAPKYYTQREDGLAQPWGGLVYVNPPFSNPKIWVAKAISEVHNDGNTRVIMLLPAAVDTQWFHELCLPHADIEFIRGRLRFHGWNGTPIGSPTSGNILAFFPKGWKDNGR
jgi:phage N-6-adenine-methyltransferase